MKDFSQYGNRPDDQWEMLPWIPDPRPPFKIWVKPEQIAPFFLIPHHPYAISLLLKINDGFRTEEFRRLGLTGSSGDWERLVRGVIREFEENNSGVGLFHFDSDEDVFCVYSQYIDDLMMLAKMIRVDEIVKGMKLHVEEQFTTIHNYIDTDAMILRKGAVSAKEGEQLLIPINMRDGSLLCVGKGNEDWNCSAPHGAGRLMSRADAKQSFTVSEFKKQMAEVYTTSVSKAT